MSDGGLVLTGGELFTLLDFKELVDGLSNVANIRYGPGHCVFDDDNLDDAILRSTLEQALLPSGGMDHREYGEPERAVTVAFLRLLLLVPEDVRLSWVGEWDGA